MKSHMLTQALWCWECLVTHLARVSSHYTSTPGSSPRDTMQYWNWRRTIPCQVHSRRTRWAFHLLMQWPVHTSSTVRHRKISLSIGIQYVQLKMEGKASSLNMKQTQEYIHSCYTNTRYRHEYRHFICTVLSCGIHHHQLHNVKDM